MKALLAAILAATCSACATAAQEPNQLTCGTLLEALQGQEIADVQSSDMAPNIAAVLGFIAGAHLATSEDRNDSSLSTFQSEVLARCRARPNKVAANVALEVATPLRWKAPSASAGVSPGAHITMEDLKLDIDGLVGVVVTVEAKILTFDAENVMLSDPDIAFDTVQIIGSIADLPRDQRQLVLRECTAMTPCRLMVTGEVAPMMFRTGIKIMGVSR